MRVNGRDYRTIWLDQDGRTVRIIDQRWLPHEFWVVGVSSCREAAEAIRDAKIQGGPLVGTAAAYGIALGMFEDPSDRGLQYALTTMRSTGVAVVQLEWSLNSVAGLLWSMEPEHRETAAYEFASGLAETDVQNNHAIGAHGFRILSELARKNPGRTLRVLTRCNPGWLATVDWGTALAAVYRSHLEGLNVHVLVDQSWPGNSEARMTSWELNAFGISNTIVSVEAGSRLIRNGDVQAVFVGALRSTTSGAICNDASMRRRAITAWEFGVPVYAAFSSTAIDWSVGRAAAGTGPADKMREGTAEMSRNPVENATPSHLLTGLITERGICSASHRGLREMFPERDAA